MEVEINTRSGPETYYYYTREEADEIGMMYLEDWRQASGAGQKVLTDDGYVVPVIKVGTNGRDGQRTFVRIPTGTFEAIDRVKMDIERKKNRFSFTGDYPQNLRITTRIRMLAMHVGGNLVDPMEAHRALWPGMKDSSRHSHLKRILQDPKVQALMREELKDALKNAGVNDRYVIDKLKDRVEDDGVSDNTFFGVIDRLTDLIDKAHDEPAPQAQLPALAGVSLEALKQITADGTVTEEAKISLQQGVSSQQLIGEEPELDASGYEDATVKEEVLEDRDAEDDADHAI